MKKILIFFFSIHLFFSSIQGQEVLNSPDGRISVKLYSDSTSSLKYIAKKDGQIVLQPSTLGLKRSDTDFLSLEISSIGNKRVVKGKYQTPAEKKLHNTFEANEWDIKLKNPDGIEIIVTFHVSNNGFAFRYIFDEVNNKVISIDKEYTSFSLPNASRAWLHPHDDVKNCWAQTCPSYEDNYLVDIPVGTTAPKKAGWSFPALFKTGNNWILISESGLTPPYCGTRLSQNSPDGEYFIEFPQQGETMKPSDPVIPKSTLPLKSPWRVVMLGDLSDIVESTMVADLAEPSRLKDTGFVKPGLAAWSWGIEKDNSVNFDRQKQYIDYAYEMTWEYVLIDVEWDKHIGYERIQELVNYAREKNVGLILWYNSSGDWNTTHYTPKSGLIEKATRRKEFQRISEMGVVGIKVDFWPGDGPSAIQYYFDVLEDAADYKLMVNFHGTTVPRGWSRTFPNLLTLESVKGFEFITFAQSTADLAPEHCAILPFSRNIVGPMDFTPVRFGEIPGIERRTSNGFEIALTVLFQSGIQHYVETPESMMQQPDYVQNYMKNVPRFWDDIKFIDGYPGVYAVIARKSGEKWYVGGINADSNIKTLQLDLSALDIKSEGVMITDGETDRDFSLKTVATQKWKLQVEVKPNGGFVMVF